MVSVLNDFSLFKISASVLFADMFLMKKIVTKFNLMHLFLKLRFPAIFPAVFFILDLEAN